MTATVPPVTEVSEAVETPPGAKPRIPSLEEWFTRVSTIAGAGIGLVAFIYVLGGAVMWLRFSKAGLPADQAVALMSKQQLLVVGLRLIVLPVCVTGSLAAALMLLRAGRGRRQEAARERADQRQAPDRRRWRERLVPGRLRRGMAAAVGWMKRRERPLMSRARRRISPLLRRVAHWLPYVPIVALLLLLPFSLASFTWVIAAVVIVVFWRREKGSGFGPALRMTLVVVLAAGLVSLGRQSDQPVQLLRASVTLKHSANPPLQGIYVTADDQTVVLGQSGSGTLQALDRADVSSVSLGPPQQRAPHDSLLSMVAGDLFAHKRFALTPVDWWCNGEHYSWAQAVGGDLCQTQPIITDTDMSLHGVWAPVVVSCPAQAHDGCSGWLRLVTVRALQRTPKGFANPITFGPVALYSPNGDHTRIAPHQLQEQCVMVPSTLRGVMRHDGPDPGAHPVPTQKVRAIITDDPEGHNVLAQATVTLHMTPHGPTSCPVNADLSSPQLTAVAFNRSAISHAAPVGLNFTLDRAARMSATLLDADGHPVRTLAEQQPFAPGKQKLRWDGLGLDGRPVPEGRYSVRLQAANAAGATQRNTDLEVDNQTPQLRAVTRKVLATDRGLVVSITDRLSGVSNATLSVGGKTYTLMRGQSRIVIRPPGGWQPHQRYVWKVVADDHAGNADQLSGAFRVK